MYVCIVGGPVVEGVVGWLQQVFQTAFIPADLLYLRQVIHIPGMD